MNIEIANRLIELRKRHGYSQEELGDKIGVSRQAVSKWESGESSPTIENIIALSKLYGVRIDEILDTDKPLKSRAPADKGGETASGEDGLAGLEKLSELEKIAEALDLDEEELNNIEVGEDGITIKKEDGREIRVSGNCVIEKGDKRYVVNKGKED